MNGIFLQRGTQEELVVRNCNFSQIIGGKGAILYSPSVFGMRNIIFKEVIFMTIDCGRNNIFEINIINSREGGKKDLYKKFQINPETLTTILIENAPLSESSCKVISLPRSFCAQLSGAQNLSFLNKKSAAAYFSVPTSGARYLNATTSKTSNLPGLHHFFDFSLHCLACFGSCHLLVSNNVFELQVVFHYETGWHQVVVVDVFDEGLHSAFSIKLFGTHLLGNLSGITFNTNNESVAKLFVLKYR